MRYIAATILLLVALAACDQQAALESFVPQAESAQVKKFIALLAARDFAAVESQLDLSLQEPTTRAKLEQVAAQIPSGQPKSITVIGAHTNKINSDVTYSLTYDYEYAESWIVANVVLEKKGESLRVSGVHVTPTRQSQKSINAFEFKGKGFVHYLFLALAVLIPAFIITTIIACKRTAIDKRKWLCEPHRVSRRLVSLSQTDTV